MDAKTLTISETALEPNMNKDETFANNGNWRLKQAIDILLDYIMQLEEKSLGDGQHSMKESGLVF